MTARWHEAVCAFLVGILLAAGVLSLTIKSQPPPAEAAAPALAASTGGAVAAGVGASAAATLAPETPPLETLPQGTVTTISPAPPTTSTTRPYVAPAVRTTPVTRAPAVVAPAPPRPPAPQPAGQADRCEAARQWASGAGLNVPAGWDYRCPDLALDAQGGQHWGLACWNCAGQSFVGINIVLIGSSDATLRYVVAHEICHANEFVTLGVSTELTADLCAALHGAPRP
jgi:hypothetical protein